MRKSFTLIELTVVFLIISVVSIVSFKSYEKTRERQILDRKITDVNTISKVLQAEYKSKGVFPSNASALGNILSGDGDKVYKNGDLLQSDINTFSLVTEENSDYSYATIATTDGVSCIETTLRYNKNDEIFTTTQSTKVFYNGCGEQIVQ